MHLCDLPHIMIKINKVLQFNPFQIFDVNYFGNFMIMVKLANSAKPSVHRLTPDLMLV